MTTVKTMRFYFYSMCAIFVLAIIGLLLAYKAPQVVSSNNGDIMYHDIKEDEVVSLAGTWEYYPNKLWSELNHSGNHEKAYVNIPHEWDSSENYNGYPYGYATYITVIHGLNPDKYYGMLIKDESLSYNLYVNNKLVVSAGKVAQTKADYVPELRTKWGVFHADQKGDALIVMEIANFDYYRGGFWVKPILGEFEAIRRIATVATNLEMMLYVSMLIMGLFLFALSAKMKNEKTALLMGLFSILVAFRILLTGYRIINAILPNVPWLLINRLEYILGYALLPIGGYIIDSLQYAKPHKLVYRSYHAMLILAIFLPLFTSNHMYAAAMDGYKYLVIVYGIYFLYLLICGIHDKKSGAIPITIGYVTLIAGALAELFIGNMPTVIGFSAFVLMGIFTTFQVVMFSSIKRHNEHLESSINIDQLTSVYNRLYLEKLMAESSLEKYHNHDWHVLFIDIDEFKNINDTYGHQAGDEALKHIAAILKQAIRFTDKAIRYGGDEFVLLLAIEKAKDAEHIKQQIHRALAEPICYGGHTISLGVSIGSTIYEIDQELLSVAIMRSDEHMYANKHAYRNHQSS